MSMETLIYKPKHSIKIVTATSLFDGHDASINIMRRILQKSFISATTVLPKRLWMQPLKKMPRE